MLRTVDKCLSLIDTRNFWTAGLPGVRRLSIQKHPEKRRDTMYDMANLKKLKTLGKGAPKAMEAFWAFDKAALADGVVPKKYKELIALAVALTTQCPYCLEIHWRYTGPQL
jgi:alkylhydroperoxidase/carboxymuconolactone decarboxylase family protein YurZ